MSSATYCTFLDCSPPSYFAILQFVRLPSHCDLTNLMSVTSVLLLTFFLTKHISYQDILGLQSMLHPSIYGSTAFRWALAAFRSLDLFTQSVGLFRRGISPSCTQDSTQTQNKHIQTSMPWVVLEPTIPEFERAKIVHALDHKATVIGPMLHSFRKILLIPLGLKLLFVIQCNRLQIWVLEL
jgi:hypothetical protein